MKNNCQIGILGRRAYMPQQGSRIHFLEITQHRRYIPAGPGNRSLDEKK